MFVLGVSATVGMLILTLLVPTFVTATAFAVEVTTTEVCGTLMLYELGANVAVDAAPEETTEAFDATGKVTVLIPLMLRLFPEMDKEGCGTLMLYELGAKVVVTAAPLDTKEALELLGSVTVLLPLILKLFPEIVKEG